MYDKEIVNVISTYHTYEYCIVNRDYKILKYSDSFSKYCACKSLHEGMADVFDVVPELVGMEEILQDIFSRILLEQCIPMVFKVPDFYVNICVYHGESSDTLIVLFEDITELTNTQQRLGQAHKENLLLLDEIKQNNKQLEAFNQEMQRLVTEEVSKNREKQQMLELQTRHAQMGEMIGMITHQWKQPLSTIQSLGTLLKIKYELGTLNKRIFDEKIDNLLTQVLHMNQTVDDFQRFFTPSKEQKLFDIKESISSVLKLVQMEYALDNINILVKEEAQVSILGYENQYKQVILAIIQNAKDALIISEQVNRQITIDIQIRGESSFVTINDNAGGIPEEIIKSVFTQYVTTKKVGLGLDSTLLKR